MPSDSPIVLYVPPFREVPRKAPRRRALAKAKGLAAPAQAVGFGEDPSNAQGAVADALEQLGAMQNLVDKAQGATAVDQTAVGNASAAVTAMSADLIFLRSALGPTPPAHFQASSFFIGVGAAAVLAAIYVSSRSSRPTRRRARRRT